jgi:hypothetical protein
MQRPRSHQIDEKAQRIFRSALPETWVLNEPQRDYAKDYLVEIGESDGRLTGSSFYVQLKGKERVTFSPDKRSALFPLNTKHAAYYLDRIKDLPVFLVLIDVTRGKGWFEFLQPRLDADQQWRKRTTVTVRLPASNDVANAVQLQLAVENAKLEGRRRGYGVSEQALQDGSIRVTIREGA